MGNIAHLHSEDEFRILSEPIRLSILRYLLSKPATISQLGELLGKHPAQIKYHVNQLEKIGVIKLAYTQTIKNYTEKYYQAKTNAVFLNRAIFSQPSDKGQIVILGGYGPALEYLVDRVNCSIGSNVFCAISVSSLDSLIYLHENYCQIAGCHLFESETGEFNINHVRHLFAFKEMVMVTFGHRDVGFMLQRGNPKQITCFMDIVNNKLRLINRPLGSGTRLRLDFLIRENNLDPHEIIGYENEAQTHLEAGKKIQDGLADIGLGPASVARMMDLDFHFLFKERYDLIMSKSVFTTPHVQRLVEELVAKSEREKIEKLGGYDMTHAGEVTII